MALQTWRSYGPAGKRGLHFSLELSGIRDSENIQKLMDELYKVTNAGNGIIDL